MKVKCDIVKCISNINGNCTSKTLEITLTHDSQSKKEYIECSNYKIKESNCKCNPHDLVYYGCRCKDKEG